MDIISSAISVNRFDSESDGGFLTIGLDNGVSLGEKSRDTGGGALEAESKGSESPALRYRFIHISVRL